MSHSQAQGLWHLVKVLKCLVVVRFPPGHNVNYSISAVMTITSQFSFVDIELFKLKYSNVHNH